MRHQEWATIVTIRTYRMFNKLDFVECMKPEFREVCLRAIRTWEPMKAIPVQVIMTMENYQAMIQFANSLNSYVTVTQVDGEEDSELYHRFWFRDKPDAMLFKLSWA